MRTCYRSLRVISQQHNKIRIIFKVESEIWWLDRLIWINAQKVLKMNSLIWTKMTKFLIFCLKKETEHILTLVRCQFWWNLRIIPWISAMHLILITMIKYLNKDPRLNLNTSQIIKEINKGLWTSISGNLRLKKNCKHSWIRYRSVRKNRKPVQIKSPVRKIKNLRQTVIWIRENNRKVKNSQLGFIAKLKVFLPVHYFHFLEVL